MRRSLDTRATRSMASADPIHHKGVKKKKKKNFPPYLLDSSFRRDIYGREEKEQAVHMTFFIGFCSCYC